MKPGWKKRGRSEEALARKPGKVPPRLLHLIVCEDAVATPRYFKALRSKLKLSTAEVEVCGEECGSAPINVVDYAIQRREEHGRAQRLIDRVWCVLDVDRHTTLDAALDKAKQHKIEIALSSPCFELWYLLHFVPGGRSYEKCERLLRDLRKHLHKYDKGSSNPFEELWPRVDAAVRHADNLIKIRDDDRCRDPSTEIHLVVNELRANAR